MVTGEKRNIDLLLTCDDIGCADNTGIDVKGVATEPCRNEEANGQQKKAGAGAGIGLGSLNNLRCTQVNLQLCRILVQNFDVPHRHINIHGRNLRITEADLRHIMHITNRGVDVELERNIEDPQILDLKKRISGNTDITIHGLRRVLIESEHVDGTFWSCLALYAMATVLSLVTGLDVDPRYLIPVNDSKYLCTKNWDTFAFDKLVEEVLSFQRTKVGLEVVPLLFLQLFYLDVVKNDMIFEKKMLKPVMTWEVTDVKRVGLGGWESTKVSVSKRDMWDEQSENIRSFDKSTLMKTSMVEDLSVVRSKFNVVKWEVGLIRSAVGRLESDTGRMRGAITTLETSLNRLEDGGLSRIVSDVVMKVLEVNQNSSSSKTNSHFD
ncbi:hypothetical protein ACLB2K_017439 [Fragaria x ananassa]